GDNLGRFESAGDMKLAIRGIHAAYEKLLADSSITGDDCGDFLKALMEVLYNCFDGRGSVVTIDEYDKPIFCAPRELGIGKEACKDIVGVYSQFYSALFKVSQLTYSAALATTLLSSLLTPTLALHL
ncbi:hypothetical protein GGF41_008321, partial [Coemansia sp. RSA 2531]